MGEYAISGDFWRRMVYIDYLYKEVARVKKMRNFAVVAAAVFAVSYSSFVFAQSGGGGSTTQTGHMMSMDTTGVWIASPSLEGAKPFNTDFPVENGLKPAWGTGGIPGIYDSTTGAFRFVCGGNGTLVRDDPIVFPGRAGASHLHLAWGSAAFNANSTPDKLAAETRSNCNATASSLNRSSYWMPALIFRWGANAGMVLRPDLVTNYYKRVRSVSPSCTASSGRAMGICVGLPNEIRFVAGWDMSKPDQPGKGMSWYCTTGDGKHYTNLDEMFASGCNGGVIVADIIFPDCWDGKNLDSPDHRSHMANFSYGSWGYPKCPSTHPYVIPTAEYKVTWNWRPEMIAKTADGTVVSNMTLASDAMKPGAKPGETLHGDYMEKWDARAKKMWHDNCIEKGLSCSGGDLGNGKQLIGASQPTYGWTIPVPIVSQPAP